MRQNQLSWRLISGVLAVGLVAPGLVPTPAAAAGGPNLSAGRSVSASGTLGGFPAASVNDGNGGTYWESPSNAFPQWVQIDLGSSVSIDQVVLKLPATWGARTQTLSLLGSTDGTTFSTLAASAGRVFNPASANAVTVDFTAASARYVRVNITANTGWPAAQVAEFEIYGVGGQTPPPGGTDLAAGKPIEASSQVFSFVATNANDGNLGTYWESAGYPATLTVKLGANADIAAVTVKLNPDPIWGPRTQTFEILGRDQGSAAYTSLKASATYSFSPSANQNSVTIPVTGRTADVQLRFTANSGAPGRAGRPSSQVIGTPAPNPDLVVTAASWSPAAPDEATPVTLSATVRNSGTAAAGATTVDFTLGGTVAGSAPVPALNAGASTTVTFNAGARPQGSYAVAATVDPANTVVEQNDANNTFTAAAPLVVAQAPGPDLQVLAHQLQPGQPGGRRGGHLHA